MEVLIYAIQVAIAIWVFFSIVDVICNELDRPKRDEEKRKPYDWKGLRKGLILIAAYLAAMGALGTYLAN